MNMVDRRGDSNRPGCIEFTDYPPPDAETPAPGKRKTTDELLVALRQAMVSQFTYPGLSRVSLLFNELDQRCKAGERPSEWNPTSNRDPTGVETEWSPASVGR